MKKLVLCAMIVASSTPFAMPSHAAPTDGPTGRKCGFNSATDVTREAGWQTGDINAGPLVTGAAGDLYCKVVVNGLPLEHSASAVVTESVAAVGGVAVMEPRALNYPATAADDISLCTSWDPAAAGAPTLYWVSQSPPNLGYWDDSAASSCGVALSIEPNDPECSIWKYIDERAGTNIAEIWQDCEPYPTFDPCAAIGNPPVVCPLPPPLGPQDRRRSA